MAANGITRPEGSLGGEQRTASLLRRVGAGAPLLLDGATGTELERRGVACELPLWSARALTQAPEVLEAIHRDYVAAGADALTANTFRTHARSLAAAGMADRARAWTELAVASARHAAATGDREIFVLGSTAPLEDCYRPDLVPSLPELEREHRAHADHLAGAGVDAVLVETMNTVREARVAALAARRPSTRSHRSAPWRWA
jgi:homocysteine S-methyltransferase